MKKQSLLPLFMLFALVALSGCADMVKKTYSPQKRGIVMYSQSSLFAGKNRTKALELADEFCRPSRAVIVSESTKREFTGRTTTNLSTSGSKTSGTSVQENSENIYINFRCNAYANM